MLQTQKPEIFRDVEVYYYDAGIYIRSTIDLRQYGINENNYNVPITILANEVYGFKIIHGLHVHSVLNGTYHNLNIGETKLMMNNNENWIVFIPFNNFEINYTEEDILFPGFEPQGDRCISYFNRNGNLNDIGWDNDTPNKTYSFGLGVE